MKVLFLGGLFPLETERSILENSIGSIQNAANNLQWEFVRGLDENLDEPVTILNSLYIGSFPRRFRKMKIDTYFFSHNNGKSKDVNVGFLNLIGIKIISRYYSLKPFVKEWIEINKEEQKVVIAYAMTSEFTAILHYIKKLDKNVLTCLIVPDLPQFMNLGKSQNIIKKMLKNIGFTFILDKIKSIDTFVLLTSYMSQALKIKKAYVVVEGISTDVFKNLEKTNFETERNTKLILYTGELNEKYGVVDLVESFRKLDYENCKLVICGSGEAEELIKKASEQDNRIEYKGLLSRNEVLHLQQNATLLVNPRRNIGEFTKFSFPSKILEYMSSGRPVLAYMLDGMPDEYRDYIYLIEDKSEYGLVHSLKEILSKSEEELNNKGRKAKEFVIARKSKLIQCKKVVEMFKREIV